MSLISTAYSWLTGLATRQSHGTQHRIPSVVAFEDVRMVGIDAALQVSTVWACVRLLTETIASLPLVLYAQNQDGMKAEIRDDQLFRIMHDMPNERQTAQEFWEFMLFNFFLRGNAYARIVRNAQGNVIALRPLSSDQVEVQRLESGAVVYVYTIDSSRFIFADVDILHIRGMGSDVVGLSPLDYMRGSVSLGIMSQSHLNKTFAKNTRRPGILMSDNVLKDEQRLALRENFGEIATGGEKELYILEAGFQFQPLGLTPADLQLLETRKFTVEDISRFFGVPSVLINDTDKSTTWGSGIQQIIEGFYKFTIRPAVERIEQSVNRRVLNQTQRAAGYMVQFELDALLRASAKDRMEIYSKAVQNGIFTRNECRRRENLEPKDGGDELTAQINLQPVDMMRENIGSQPDVAQDPIAQ